MLPLPSVPLPSASGKTSSLPAHFLTSRAARSHSKSQFVWFDLFLNRTNTSKLKSPVPSAEPLDVTLLRGAGSGLPHWLRRHRIWHPLIRLPVVAFEGLAGFFMAIPSKKILRWEAQLITGPEHGANFEWTGLLEWPWSTRKIFNKFSGQVTRGTKMEAPLERTTCAHNSIDLDTMFAKKNITST